MPITFLILFLGVLDMGTVLSFPILFQWYRYPYSEHYGRRIPSYFPKEIVADYVGGYTEKNKLDRYITHGKLSVHGSALYNSLLYASL